MMFSNGSPAVDRRRTLRLYLPLAAASAGMGYLFLTELSDTPSSPAQLVVTPSPVAIPTPPAAMPGDGPALLTQVTVDGPFSSARFVFAIGPERTIRLHETLMPGWVLTAVDSGSVTLATPNGSRRLELGAAPPENLQAASRTGDEPVTLVPETPAKSGDGSAAIRCNDPEC